jgi:hypothetical protein
LVFPRPGADYVAPGKKGFSDPIVFSCCKTVLYKRQ